MCDFGILQKSFLLRFHARNNLSAMPNFLRGLMDFITAVRAPSIIECKMNNI